MAIIFCSLLSHAPDPCPDPLVPPKLTYPHKNKILYFMHEFFSKFLLQTKMHELEVTIETIFNLYMT